MSKDIEEALLKIQKRLDDIEGIDRARKGEDLSFERDLDNVTLELDRLVGLEEVKKEVNKLIYYLKFVNRLQKQQYRFQYIHLL